MREVMGVLADRVSRLRHERKWTLYRLSRVASVPVVTIQRLEKTQQKGVDVKAVRLLAKAFGVSVDYVVGTNEPDVESEAANAA